MTLANGKTIKENLEEILSTTKAKTLYRVVIHNYGLQCKEVGTPIDSLDKRAEDIEKGIEEYTAPVPDMYAVGLGVREVDGWLGHGIDLEVRILLKETTL